MTQVERETFTWEALLVAEVDVEKARDKDYVIPGEYELYLFGHRRPELYGALVALPTNFPMAARLQCDVIAPARAAENRIYLLVANRVGKERWGEFCGRSQIVDPFGNRLAETDVTSETLLVADVDLEKARDKDYVVPGEYELYLFGHRRPELYGALVEEQSAVEA